MAGPQLQAVQQSAQQSSIDSGTLCRRQSFSPAPLGMDGPRSGALGVMVVNSYDASEGIAHDVEIQALGGVQVDRYRVDRETAAGRSPGGLLHCLSGRYVITVRPLPAAGQSIGPKAFGPAFTRDVDLDPAASHGVTFRVTRKQSILHNIPMTFSVQANPNADGGEPLHELDSMSQVIEHKALIEAEARRQGVDVDLVKAIVYMESTHGWYDMLAAPFDKNESILPMNVRSGYWRDLGFTREQLKDPKTNIEAGVLLIKRISARVDPKSIETIATLYQDLGRTSVTDYGARVGEIYRQKLWIPEPSLLDKLKMKLQEFERMTPQQQIRFLERMFGG